MPPAAPPTPRPWPGPSSTTRAPGAAGRLHLVRLAAVLHQQLRLGVRVQRRGAISSTADGPASSARSVASAPRPPSRTTSGPGRAPPGARRAAARRRGSPRRALRAADHPGPVGSGRERRGVAGHAAQQPGGRKPSASGRAASRAAGTGVRGAASRGCRRRGSRRATGRDRRSGRTRWSRRRRSCSRSSRRASPGSRRDVGAERPCSAAAPVQVVQHGAEADPRGPRVRVDRDRRQRRGVDHQPGPHGLAAQAGPPAPHREGCRSPRRRRRRRPGRRVGARRCRGQPSVDARVVRVELPRGAVGAQLPRAERPSDASSAGPSMRGMVRSPGPFPRRPGAAARAAGQGWFARPTSALRAPGSSLRGLMAARFAPRGVSPGEERPAGRDGPAQRDESDGEGEVRRVEAA